MNIKNLILLIVLCTSSLTFAMETQKTAKSKIKSLTELATQAMLKKPREIIIIQEKQIPLPPACIMTIHETLLRKAQSPESLQRRSSDYISKLYKKSYYFDIRQIFYKRWTVRKEFESRLSNSYENASLSQLCLLAIIENKQKKQRTLKLAINEAKLFDDLSLALKNEFAQHVIHPSLLQNLLASCKKQLWEIL